MSIHQFIVDHPFIHTLNSFLPHPFVLLVAVFVVRVAALTWLEQTRGLYKNSLSAVFTTDLIITLWVGLIVGPLGTRYSSWMQVTTLAPRPWAAVAAHWTSLPLAARVLAYVVLADFGHYVLHRLEHTKMFWSVHRWHHIANHMGFLAGKRISLLDRMLTVFPYAFFAPLVLPAPGWVWVGLAFFAMFRDDWMHLNMGWGSRWWEWVFVTPRYHHIHHSDNKAHYDRNLGVFFSLWDRLFGTYVDPEGLTGRLKFGTGEQVPGARLIVGL